MQQLIIQAIIRNMNLELALHEFGGPFLAFSLSSLFMRLIMLLAPS